MQSVEYVRSWWILRACGRNPLVRGIDRLELLIIALGILVALVAVACAGALGTAVHDARRASAAVDVVAHDASRELMSRPTVGLLRCTHRHRR
jgi:hypothetical protein